MILKKKTHFENNNYTLEYRYLLTDCLHPSYICIEDKPFSVIGL